ncbi:hypothetical protein GCM10010145_46760 [Streptomyces ruber]|uniref:Uncharacterized protein n=2 Tax=Streptomyces TaxID=1883 RepID=A0A918BIN7_9ACTN|nr:hypothetical protein [Streptomyces ruber]GGQ71866.1 hypothetical protein GCM10010145_46760 [Streptomyces ruber]
MSSMLSAVNEDERIADLNFETAQPEMLADEAVPVLCTPAVLVAGINAANAVRTALVG